MRKIIDDRGRLFGLISFIDVIVLVVVIVLAIAVFTKYNVEDNPLTPTNTVKVTFTFKIPAIRLLTANHYRPGDSIYTDKGAYIGTITAVDIQDAKAVETVVDGTYVEAKVHERYDVTLTVETQCSYSNGRYYADRVVELNANAEYSTRTKYVLATGAILTIAEG